MKKPIGLILFASIIALYSCSHLISSKKAIALLSPIGGERWITGKTYNITWETTGEIPKVVIFYSKDNFVNDIHRVTDVILNKGAYKWQTPDDRCANGKIKVCDADDLNLYGKSPNEFKIDYYSIRWHLKDEVTGEHLKNITVSCSSGFTKQKLSSPFSIDYPYGVYTTLFSPVHYLPEIKKEWFADKDENFSSSMESATYTDWHVYVDFEYDTTTDNLSAKCWFEQTNNIATNPQKVTIRIFNQNGSLVKILESNQPDKNGIFHIQWNNSALAENTTYKTKTSLILNNTEYKTDFDYELRIPMSNCNLRDIMPASPTDEPAGGPDSKK